MGGTGMTYVKIPTIIYFFLLIIVYFQCTIFIYFMTRQSYNKDGKNIINNINGNIIKQMCNII